MIEQLLAEQQRGAFVPSRGATVKLQKDDSSPQTIITYYLLFALFVALALFGIANLILVHKIRKNSKQVATFYLVSGTVLIFRILLFFDPVIDWADYTYVVVFITFPAYLYLFVGLSQVMLTMESIMKIKNFKVRQEESIKQVNLKRKLARNQRILDIGYYVLWLAILIVIVLFASKQVMCMQQQTTFEQAFMWTVPLAISNVIVWILLAVSTCTFVVMLRRRFAESEFSGPRRKLIGFLSVFSLSFFVRATWDLVAEAVHMKSELSMALLVFFIYFLTEWVPIFVIYMYHFWAFYQHYKMKQQEKQEDLEQEPQNSRESVNQTRKDEFRMLLVHAPRSPQSSSRAIRSGNAQPLNVSLAIHTSRSQEDSNVAALPLLAPSQRQSKNAPSISAFQASDATTKATRQDRLPTFEDGQRESVALYLEKQGSSSELDARTEYGENRFFKRATDVITKDDLTFVNRESVSQSDSMPEYQETTGQQKRIHSFFKSEQGASLLVLRGNPGPLRRTDLLHSHTLQPISSDSGGGNSQSNAESQLGLEVAEFKANANEIGSFDFNVKRVVDFTKVSSDAGQLPSFVRPDKIKPNKDYISLLSSPRVEEISEPTSPTFAQRKSRKD